MSPPPGIPTDPLPGAICPQFAADLMARFEPQIRARLLLRIKGASRSHGGRTVTDAIASASVELVRYAREGRLSPHAHEAQLRSLIFTMAYHRMLDAIRSESAERRAIGQCSHQTLARSTVQPPGGDPSSHLGALDRDDYAIVRMCAEGRSSGHIAAAIGVSDQRVRTRLRTIRSWFRYATDA